MNYQTDFWYKHKTQNFKIGEWFYLYNGKTIKLKLQEVINIKLGIKVTLGLYSVKIHKICRIEDDKVFFLTKESIEVK